MSEKAKKLRILLIDDDPDICRLVKYGLELDQRYKVLVAPGGKMGSWLAVCRWHRPSLILLDIKMPGLDGFAVLEKLRADARTRFAPIIMFTAFDDPALRIKAEGLYCDGCVLKSESIQGLKQKIEEVLTRRGLL